MKINKDMLKVKEAKLNELNRKSADAVDIVTGTIQNLQIVNDEINATVEDIEDYRNKLNDTKCSLETTRLNNSRIISNFKKLLEV
ncbi:hypothetical protein [Anaerovorax sp. IOR16]|uniref:hypothetical protein n=1 Tax=Anaerovorax sp. IOR16 TaxID=2773458 RepID=UPI0019D2B0FD|nr:hypothetical protein [Anaerovorax sp. IOR16]